MPGNEVGGRVHDFFQQGNLSQSQHQTQAVQENWSGFNSNLLSGNERQTGGAVISKTYDAQQSGSERWQGNQFSLGLYGLNYAPSHARSDFAKSQLQNQQLFHNGFAHGAEAAHTVQNESNGFGMEEESAQRNLMSNGMHILESQHRTGPQHSDLMSANFGSKEPPMNFDFLGGQQQMNGQHPGFFQSLARQQSGMSDGQLLQQQVMLKQMQELQRQQQIQQLETMQRNPSPISHYSNQGVGNHASTFINGTPVHDSPSYPWSSQVSGNTNLVQQRGSPSPQGYSNGMMISNEQGHQALHLMGLLPQQVQQSLYGIPVSSARSGGAFLPNQIDKSGLHQMPIQGNYSPSPSQHPMLLEQGSLQEGKMMSRQGFEGRVSSEHFSGEDSGGLLNIESFNQMQPTPSIQLDGGRDKVISSTLSLSEQTAIQVGSSQEAAGLDPTEAKILFGNDDNIWEAFGGSLDGSAGGQDQSEGAFPSLHSGSWSALMQSAVAESSSGDGGIQGEWTGVGLQQSGSVAGNQQLPGFPDNRKQSSSWVDSSQLTSLTSRPPQNDANLSSNFHNSGQNPYLRQPRESLQTRSGHQSSEEARKWLDHNQSNTVVQRSQIHESTYSPGDLNLKNSSSYWSHQQKISSHGDQNSNRPGTVNFAQSILSDGRNFSGNRGGDFDRGMNANVGHGGAISMLGSQPISNFETTRHPMNSKDDAMRISSNIKRNLGSDIVHRESRRPGASAGRSKDDGVSKYQHNLNKVMPQVLDSSMNSCDRGTADMHEVGNRDNRENSRDSYGSNLPARAATGGLRENTWPDAGTYSLSGSKQNSSGQASQGTTPAPRKFQYHPMGEVNMDMDHSYGTKNILLSQSSTHNLYGVLKIQEGQSRFSNPVASNPAMTKKGFVTNHQGDVQVSHGVSSRAISPGFTSAASAPIDVSADISTPSSSGTSSGQRMLELLHKVDQSKEQSADRIRTSAATNAAVPGNAGLGPKQSSSSSSSQGFSLQLAPPSQGLRAPNLMMSSQSPSQTVSSPNPSHVALDKGDHRHAWLSSGASSQSLPSVHQNHKEESHINMPAMPRNNNSDTLQHNMQMSFPANVASEPLYKRNMLQNQHMNDNAGDISHNDSASQRETGQPGAKVLMQQMPMMDSSTPFQLSAMPGISQKGNLSSIIPNMWTNLTTQQQISGAHSINPGDSLKTRFSSNGTLGKNISNSQQKVEEDALRNEDAVPGQGLSSRGVHLEPGRQLDPSNGATIKSKGKEASIPYFPDASHPLSGSKAVEQTLKPSGGMVIHQVQSMKDVDPENRQVKRFKGPESASDDQQMVGKLNPPFSGGSNHVDRNSLNHASCSSGDAKIFRFSPQYGTEREKQFQLQGNLASHNLVPAQVDLQKLSGSTANAQVSRQMAPTWFDKYGTLKNGQLLPMHEAHRAQAVTSIGQQIDKGAKEMGSDNLSLSKVNVVDSCQMGNEWSTTKSYVPSEHLPSQNSLVSGSITVSVDSLRPKKRKIANVNLLPWHKEVALVSQRRLPNISLAEDEWAQTSHHLFEKIQDEVFPNEVVTSRIRSRRRLVLTAQLMQQILRPPPREFISLDASTICETIAYFVARLALGDACSYVCQSESNSSVTCNERNQSEKLKTHDKISYQYLAKVTEDSISRASTLEHEFSRLEKIVSFLDLRLECQDLEKFSIINRFARFHGRGQVDEVESSSSSSSDPAMATQRVRPLRYVNAYPSPRNLPEKVHCFTL